MSTLRLHAVLTGIVLGLLLCAAGPFNNAWLANTSLGGGHFPLAPFFIVFVLYLANAFIAKSTGKLLYNGLEHLVIWLFMVVGTGIGYAGLVETFFLNITAPAYYAKDGFEWVKTLSPYLPDSWFQNDLEAVNGLYNGLTNGRTMSATQLFHAIPWGAWLPVLLLWAAFILAAYLTMLCIVNLLGRQWVENERINFPLLRVQQVLSDNLDNGTMGGLLRDSYLLWGIAIPVMLHTLNGLHYHLPSVPEFPTIVLAGKFFPKFGLFSGFRRLNIYIIPAFIGFGFLTTRQISFSLWFFHLFGALFMGILYVMGLEVPEAAMGVTFGPNLARPAEAQVIGAWLVFFLFIIWLARGHLKQCTLAAFGKGFTGAQAGEYMPSGISFWGMWGGIAFMAGWCYSFGMTPLGSILVPLVMLMVMVVTSRVITQGGLPQFMLTAAPSDGFIGLFGSGFLGSAGIVVTSVIQKMLFLDIRESLMPSLVHGAKISERSRGKLLFLAGLGVMLVASIATAFTSMLMLGYKTGLRELQQEWAVTSTGAIFENAARLVSAPTEPNSIIISFATLGAVIMFVLVFCYYRFHWWPLHPIGFIAAYSKSMRIIWFCFLIGWLCNNLVLRYGGTRLFRKLQLFFIGLIIGDVLMGGIWAISALFTGTVYQVFPL